ncbi:hypothetical protein GQX73_g8064 [Xylaria multiplex]|uniref:Uncharacterized protein n=1 Tax=Xylaria multiplex TaxID=323545 RepID=A0A7C8MNF3_9PEZI|nr:hypothetical protein GQX73_g8064 [Xylaria multiplex]
MSSSRHSKATQYFRPEYPIRTTSSQQAQYRQDQLAYTQVPPNVRQDLLRYAHKVDGRTREWEQRFKEREKAWEDTTTARMERRDRSDPEIRYLRNKKNREEHALAKLDHAQRDYMNALKGSGDHVDTINRIQRNRIPEISNYSVPAEIQNSIGRHADYDYRPAMLPSRREYWRPK